MVINATADELVEYVNSMRVKMSDHETVISCLHTLEKEFYCGVRKPRNVYDPDNPSISELSLFFKDISVELQRLWAIEETK